MRHCKDHVRQAERLDDMSCCQRQSFCTIHQKKDASLGVQLTRSFRQFTIIGSGNKACASDNPSDEEESWKVGPCNLGAIVRAWARSFVRPPVLTLLLIGLPLRAVSQAKKNPTKSENSPRPATRDCMLRLPRTKSRYQKQMIRCVCTHQLTRLFRKRLKTY